VGPGVGLDALEKRKISCPCQDLKPWIEQPVNESLWWQLHQCKMMNIEKNVFHTKVKRTMRDTAVMFYTSQQIRELTKTGSNYRFAGDRSSCKKKLACNLKIIH
jgi:hypothetical protein